MHFLVITVLFFGKVVYILLVVVYTTEKIKF